MSPLARFSNHAFEYDSNITVQAKTSKALIDTALRFVTPEKVSLYDEIPIFRGSHLLVLFEFNLIVK